MADISTLLKRILSARFGEDVRQSIHDALSSINSSKVETSTADSKYLSKTDAGNTYVKKTDKATASTAGIVKLHGNNSGLSLDNEGGLSINVPASGSAVDGQYGLSRDSSSQLKVKPATTEELKAGTHEYKPITPKVLWPILKGLIGSQVFFFDTNQFTRIRAGNDVSYSDTSYPQYHTHENGLYIIVPALDSDEHRITSITFTDQSNLQRTLSGISLQNGYVYLAYIGSTSSACSLVTSISLSGGGGGDISIDSSLSTTSVNPVQNRAIASAIIDLRANVETLTEQGVGDLNVYNCTDRAHDGVQHIEPNEDGTIIRQGYYLYTSIGTSEEIEILSELVNPHAATYSVRLTSGLFKPGYTYLMYVGSTSEVKLTIPPNIGTISDKVDLLEGKVIDSFNYVGECQDAVTKINKEVSVDSSFTLKDKVIVTVRFTNGLMSTLQSESPVSLNVNRTGAYVINVNGTDSTSLFNREKYITEMGGTLSFMFEAYDEGGVWCLIGSEYVGRAMIADSVETGSITENSLDAPLAAKVNKIEIYQGNSPEAASATARTANISGFPLAYAAGQLVLMTFDGNINGTEVGGETGDQHTLNINSMGAKPIYFDGYTSDGYDEGTRLVANGSPVLLQYNGAAWDAVMVDYVQSSGFAYNAKGMLAKRIIYSGICSTAAATAAKTVTIVGFPTTLSNELTARVRFTNGITSGGSSTLNINNTGAKAIKVCSSVDGLSYFTGIAEGAEVVLAYNSTADVWVVVGSGLAWYADTAGQLDANSTQANVLLPSFYNAASSITTETFTSIIEDIDNAYGTMTNIDFTNAIITPNYGYRRLISISFTSGANPTNFGVPENWTLIGDDADFQDGVFIPRANVWYDILIEYRNGRVTGWVQGIDIEEETE